MHKIKLPILFVGLVAIFVAYSFIKERSLSEDGVHYFIFSKEDTEKISGKDEKKIKIEVYATRNGDKFKAILQPHTFIYTPERIAYTQNGFKHVYFFLTPRRIAKLERVL